MIIPPPWSDIPPEHLDPLPPDARADIVIIGAGVAGLSAGYMLACENLSVMVLEAAAPGGGMTGKSTAHVSNAIDDGWRRLVEVVGPSQASCAAQAYSRGIAMIAETCMRERIACDFSRVDGYLVGTEAQAETLAEELRAAKTAGLVDAEWAAPPYGPASHVAVRFPGQARLHPVKYVNGLVRAIRTRGGKVYRAFANRIDNSTAPIGVATDAGFVTADVAVVLAKNVFEDFPGRTLPQRTYKSYVIAVEVLKSATSDAISWDLEDPYHYTRLQPGAGSADLLIIGGEDHPANESRDPARAFARLESWARLQFPFARDVVSRWTGEIKQTADNLGFMGRAAGGTDIYLIDGDGGLGFNHATIGSQIICDQIMGRNNPWTDIFRPDRRVDGRRA